MISLSIYYKYQLRMKVPVTQVYFFFQINISGVDIDPL